MHAAWSVTGKGRKKGTAKFLYGEGGGKELGGRGHRSGKVSEEQHLAV